MWIFSADEIISSKTPRMEIPIIVEMPT